MSPEQLLPTPMNKQEHVFLETTKCLVFSRWVPFSISLTYILKSKQAGNVIAVRGCARFPGWEMDAHSARLVVRISNKGGMSLSTRPSSNSHRCRMLGPRKAVAKPTVDWEAVVKSNEHLQEQLAVYLDDVTPQGIAPAISVETTLLTQELRSDRQYGSGGRPLRLLSLGEYCLHKIEVIH